MKRLLMFSVLMCLFAPLVFGAFIDFDKVTTYVDGSAIAPAKIPTIQYRGYYGVSPTGPWTPAGVVTDNLTITAPDPAVGGTMWYTVDATLDGQTSNKGVAASKGIPFPNPAGTRVRGVR